jgi:hypothetical protein
MKLQSLLATILLLLCFHSFSQTTIPEGFVPGKIILSDGTEQSGYLKDNMRKKSTVIFYNPNNNKKQNLDANNLSEVYLNDTRFLCLYGDFFKVIQTGENNILIKSSDASGKPFFNGIETVINNGTAGKIDDRFEYNADDRILKQNRKN